MTLKDYLMKQKKYIQLYEGTIGYTLFSSRYCAIGYPSINEDRFIYCYDIETKKIISSKDFNTYLTKYFGKILDLKIEGNKSINSISIKSPCLLISIEFRNNTEDTPYISIRPYKISKILDSGFYVRHLNTTHLYYPTLNKVYFSNGNDFQRKYIPLNIKDEIDFIDNYDESILLGYEKLKQAQDVLKRYTGIKKEFSKTPFTYEEILNSNESNNKYLMRHHYKSLANKINWNKFRLNECITLNQLSNHLTTKDFANLYTDFLHNKQDYYDFMERYCEDFTNDVREQYWNWYQIYIIRKIMKNALHCPIDELEQVANDYVYGLMESKAKQLPCNFNSLKRLRNEEAYLLERLNLEENYKSLVAPDKVLFDDKQKIWKKAISNLKHANIPIKILDTRRKLTHEGIVQHNCVGSYDDYVANGTSFIFHYTHSNNDQYTVEVNREIKHNVVTYKIIQIYKKYNQNPDLDVKQYLEEILNKNISKQKI